MKKLFVGDVYIRENGTVGWLPLGDGLDIQTFPYADAPRLALSVKHRLQKVTEDNIEKMAAGFLRTIDEQIGILEGAMVAADVYLQAMRTVPDHELDRIRKKVDEATSSAIFGNGSIVAALSPVFNKGELIQAVGNIQNHINNRTYPDYDETLSVSIERELDVFFGRSFCNNREDGFYRQLADFLAQDRASPAAADTIKAAIRFNLHTIKNDPLAVIHSSAEHYTQAQHGVDKTQLADLVDALRNDADNAENALRKPLSKALDALGTICLVGHNQGQLEHVSHNTHRLRMYNFIMSAFEQVLGKAFMPPPSAIGLSHTGAPIILTTSVQNHTKTLSEEAFHAIDSHFPFGEEGRDLADNIPRFVVEALQKWSGQTIAEIQAEIGTLDTRESVQKLNQFVLRIKDSIVAEKNLSEGEGTILGNIIFTYLTKMLGAYEEKKIPVELFAVSGQYHFAEKDIDADGDTQKMPEGLYEGMVRKALRAFSEEIASALDAIETELSRNVTQTRTKKDGEETDPDFLALQLYTRNIAAIEQVKGRMM